MIEAVWPGGALVLVGLVALFILEVRRRSRYLKHEDSRVGNETTGVFLKADLEPDSEPTVAILQKPIQESLENWTRLPAPMRDPRAINERVATPDQRLEAKFQSIVRRQSEEWSELIERHRCEWRTLLSEFDNGMEWGNLVRYGGELEDRQYVLAITD